jgi:hypothetical protein
MESWGEEGVVLDLNRLERQAEDLDLDEFADAIRRTRGRLGRYLIVRLEEVSEATPRLDAVPPGTRSRACSGGQR